MATRKFSVDVASLPDELFRALRRLNVVEQVVEPVDMGGADSVWQRDALESIEGVTGVGRQLVRRGLDEQGRDVLVIKFRLVNQHYERQFQFYTILKVLQLTYPTTSSKKLDNDLPSGSEMYFRAHSNGSITISWDIFLVK